jgi:AcrR family transcriptional regulator
MVVAAKRTDKRVVRTREALMQSGYVLFAERGLYDVSIDEIIEKAEISKQTFYNHFSDKAALARDIYLSIRNEIESEIRLTNQGIDDPAVRIARGVCIYVRTALKAPDHIRFITRLLVHEIGLEDPANEGLIQDLEIGLSTGRLLVRSFETGAAFVLGASEPLLLSVVGHPNKSQVMSLTQDFLTLILRGLCVPPADAELISAQAANTVLR